MPELTSPGRLKAFMQAHGLRPDKALGQSYLADPRLLERICAAADLAPEDVVLEIGPGLGTLTRAIARRAGRVVAVELDRRLVAVLESALLSDLDNVELFQGDALQLDLLTLLRDRLNPGARAKVVANLPYYITTPLVLRLLETDLPLSHVVVMVQKEVADRMVAAPGTKEYGALSVAVHYYTVPRLVMPVPRCAFVPAPAVDSALVAMAVRGEPPVVADRKRLFGVVRAAFGQRRKTLLNAVSAGLHLPKEQVEAACAAGGIDSGRRGETLSLAEFAHLSRALEIGVTEEDSE